MDLEEEGEEAIIDVGAHVTNIVVHARGNTRFVRILPSGGRDVTLAIARAAGIEDDVAERLEARRGGRGSAITGRDPRRRAHPGVRVRGRDPILTRVLHGAGEGRPDRQGHDHRGGSKLEGLLDLMRQRITVPVDPGAVFQHVPSQLSLSPEASADAEPVLAVAIGLADPGSGLVSQVNLLPPEILQGQKYRRSAVAVLLGGVVLLVFIFAFYLLQIQRLSSVEDDISAQELTNAGLQEQIDGLQEFEDLKIQAEQTEAVLASAYQNEVSFSGLLLDLSRVMPSEAYLQDYTAAITTTGGAPGEGTAADTGVRRQPSRWAARRSASTRSACSLVRLETGEGLGQPVGLVGDISRSSPSMRSASPSTVDLTNEVVTQARARAR